MREVITVVLVAVLACEIALCDDVTPKIILPQVPVLIQPDDDPPVIPADPTAPQPVSQLAADQWYVIESSVPLIVLASPAGLVGIDQSEGPIRVRGKFADGTGGIETRTFSQPHIYFIDAIKPGVIELLIIPLGIQAEADIIRQPITVMGTAPRPPPVDPVDPPKPDDPVVPPVTVGKIQVVIIEDPLDRAVIPASQISVMDGRAVREYVRTHGPSTTDSNFRLLSLRQDVSGQPAWIKDAFALPRPGVPFLVIVTATQNVAGPLPMTVEETLTLLQKYGGP